ncbi:MAG: HlyD family efflux transporter periplasmic adaptor subunit [Saprospiraceae bacterium]
MKNGINPIEEPSYVELRSEDVQEILGTPPHWLVRWGTAIVLVGFGLMLCAAWFIRYPDVVEGKVVITTVIPPVDVVARASGRVRLLVPDKKLVQENELLAVLQSTADYNDVLNLEMAVDAWQRSDLDSLKSLIPERNLTLGDIQADYVDFVQNLENFQLGKSGRSTVTTSNINSIKQQIAQLEQSIAYEERGLKRVNDQLKIAEELYEKQKELYEQGITSRVDFEEERTKLANLERQRDLYEDNILRKRSEIINLRKGITEQSISQTENTSETSSRLLGSLNTLRSSINKWKQTYLITSPIVGRVSLVATEKKFVKEGEPILTIVPQQSKAIVGRVMLPVEVSGKVKKEQRVIIKLDSYPYQEYGVMRGFVLDKSLVPRDNQYVITVSVPTNENNNLKTSYDREIIFEQQLQGKVEIITEDKGFITRITEHIFSVR